MTPKNPAQFAYIVEARRYRVHVFRPWGKQPDRVYLNILPTSVDRLQRLARQYPLRVHRRK